MVDRAVRRLCLPHHRARATCHQLRDNPTALKVQGQMPYRWVSSQGILVRTSHDRSYLVVDRVSRLPNDLRARVEAAPTWHKCGLRRSVEGYTCDDANARCVA